jgi:hypothetical protein
MLTANRTYYVRTDGSNANSGLANSPVGAFPTIQKAIDTVYGTLETWAASTSPASSRPGPKRRGQLSPISDVGATLHYRRSESGGAGCRQ